jgi:hypothetical protein
VVDLLEAPLIIEDAGLKAEGVRQPRERSFDVAIGKGRIHVHGSLLLSGESNPYAVEEDASHHPGSSRAPGSG